MVFAVGQFVRIKDKKILGKIEKKLASLDDVYVVLCEESSRAGEKLVRGDDLELASDHEDRPSL
ncbi:MAG TPA: hypothetical protein VHX37_04970 [Acidobacteriaceae bacterium]|jgi:hypothetical protein|nr:hypothetical protein [Acidobacteriaceae bacterium]